MIKTMEYTKETTDRFLNLYRQLEAIRGNNPALFAYYQRKYGDQFEQFRALRNLLSHEEYGGGYPIAISSQIVSSFQRILEQMGLSAYEVSTKRIESLQERSLLSEAFSLFADKGYGYLPILRQKKTVLGVITPQKLISLQSKVEGLPAYKVSSFLPEFSLGNQSKRFHFLRRNAPLYEAEELFLQAGSKRVGLLFLTEHGKEEESLLSLLSVYDVLKKTRKDSEGRSLPLE